MNKPDKRPDKKIEEIRNNVRKNLHPYFMKFCSLEALENFPIDLKKSLYYYVVENIIPYVYESSFKEVLCHPEIIKKVRKSIAVNWIMLVIFGMGFIFGVCIMGILTMRKM